ncbi:MAG: T9SS type A sorting domain-containing protein [Bacteroidetes bacterium]|nr:T9SS type A sorting domain-containing protein [Bacteroidota bacterium]
MKFKAFFTILLLLLGSSSRACPITFVGYVKIVDEKGKVLHDAKFWRVYSANDSFEISKRSYLNENNSDTDKYSIYVGGYPRRQIEPFDRYYRIQCPGYTDVVIGDLNFDELENSDSYKFPTLYIVMYPNRFIQKGNYFIKLNQFYLDEVTADKDSSVVSLAEYSQVLMNESTDLTYERVLKSAYLTYPNPVINEITVEVKDSLPQPFKVIVYDLLGKIVFESEITEQKQTFDLSELIAGSYYIRINNTQGEMKHCMRFVKAE